AIVTYTAGAADACGLASFACAPPSGITFPIGATTVTCSANDTASNSATCMFTVTVRNQPPLCALSIACASSLNGNAQVIAINDSTACVVLDGSGSSDPENDTLEFAWVVDRTNVLAGAVVTNCLSLGC